MKVLRVSFFCSLTDATVANPLLDIAKLGEPRATMSTKINSKSPRKEQSRLDRFWPPSIVPRSDLHVDTSHVLDQHPSSDEFGSDIEDSALAETPLFGSESYPGANKSLVQDEETFVTPPSTPPHSHKVNSDSILQSPEPVQLPQPSLPSKKRSSEESMRPPSARKITRSRSESQRRKLYNLNYLEPAEAPISDTVPIAIPEERRRTPAELHLSNSFDSTTSFGTSAVTTSSTSGTRNTSFYANSMTTSFDSSIGTMDSYDNIMHERSSQTTKPEAKNSDYNIREYESMDVDDSETVLLQRTDWVSLSPTKEVSANSMEHGRTSNRKEVEYLAEQFFPPSLLSMDMVDEYDLPLTSLISSRSNGFSQRSCRIISSVIRSY